MLKQTDRIGLEIAKLMFFGTYETDLPEKVRYQGLYREPFKSSEFPRVRFNREAED
jgi:hypothetical protein